MQRTYQIEMCDNSIKTTSSLIAQNETLPVSHVNQFWITVDPRRLNQFQPIDLSQDILLDKGELLRKQCTIILQDEW
jgi:hypothetical protein